MLRFRLLFQLVLLIVFSAAPVFAGAPAVYTWANVHEPGMIPMARIDCMNDTPVAAVSHVASAFSNLPQAQRALLLFGVLRNPDVFALSNLKQNVLNGPDCSSEQRFLQMIFRRLAAQHLAPSRIVTDLETVNSTWRLWPGNGTISTVLMPVFSDPNCFAKLPASVQRYSPADFDNYRSRRGRAATIAWNAWQGNVLDAAIRQTVSQTAAQWFGPGIAVTNYGDCRPTFPAYDDNGWPLVTMSVGKESSPSLYIESKLFTYRPTSKDPRWNHFINALNMARSCAGSGPLVPWVSYPSYGGDANPNGGSTWLWQQLIAHLNQLGVKEYLLFNPAPSATAADNALASQTFRSLPPPGVAPKGGYTSIPFDANVVVTGSVRTTYADFLKNAPALGAAAK